MAHIITKLENFDNKRTKVTLDYSEVTFLLYKAEIRSLKINEGEALTDEELGRINDEILLPRAKKRVLYFMKNADKTRYQIRKKLREGLYPEEIIERTMEFLDKYGFADDEQYAENYIEELKGSRSRREIEAKLRSKGLSSQMLKESLTNVTAEDEYAAAEKALSRKYPQGIAAEDKNKAYGFLMSKGYSYDSIEHAMNILKADS